MSDSIHVNPENTCIAEIQVNNVTQYVTMEASSVLIAISSSVTEMPYQTKPCVTEKLYITKDVGCNK